MEVIGVIFSTLLGLFLIVSGVMGYVVASGFGSLHKIDYIYPICLFLVGLFIEYYIFFKVITISIGAKD